MPSLLPQNILYEDNHILVVNKPSGIPTQPAADSGQTNSSLEDICKNFIKERDNKSGGVFLHAIFRLDKPVSGIVLFAKSHKALVRLNELQRKKQYTKEYTALVGSSLPPSSLLPKGVLVDDLLHEDYCARVARTEEEKRHAKRAELRIEEASVLAPATQPFRIVLIRLQLMTGRYHQIRIQLASRGWPILGDERYGGAPYPYTIGTCSFHRDAIALHHARLSFPRIIRSSGEEGPFIFSSPAPWEKR